MRGIAQLAGLQRCGRSAPRDSQAEPAILNGKGSWSRHADSNCGPAVYEVDRPKRCGPSVESRALGAESAGLRFRAFRRGLRGGRDGRPDRTPDGSGAGRSLVSVIASALRHLPLAWMDLEVVHHVCPCPASSFSPQVVTVYGVWPRRPVTADLAVADHRWQPESTLTRREPTSWGLSRSILRRGSATTADRKAVQSTASHARSCRSAASSARSNAIPPRSGSGSCQSPGTHRPSRQGG
jgi:hypothetical protein